MSKSQSNISPARSTGAVAPRRSRTRRTLSSASPAQVEGRLSTVIEKFLKNDKFVLSPMKRKSVLPDDTDIEAPRRASWWKRLEGSSRDVLEALDTNKMTDDLLLEEYEFEVEKDDKQSQSVQQSQSSDNESVASIVVPQRRLFNQKKQTQAKFGDIMGSRKSLGKTNIEDHSIEDAPKNIFNKGPRNKPVFPAALLNSTNKTINKTVEPETNKPARPNLFGQAGGKRKNMFTDFVLSDSEEDSEVQHKVFGFKKNNNKRISLGTRNRRMPSLTPSMTTEIDIDDWNLLPSSTMIGAQENSRMSDKDMELVQDANQDDTLTENNASLNRTKQHKSMKQNDVNDKTLTNENIEDDIQDMKATDESKKVNRSNTKLNESVKDRTSQNKSNKHNFEVDAATVRQQGNSANDNDGLGENEQSVEDKMAQLYGVNVNNEESREKIVSKTQDNIKEAKTINCPNDAKGIEEIDQSAKTRDILNHSKTANNAIQNESLRLKNKTREDIDQSVKGQKCTYVSKDVVTTNQDEEMQNKSELDKNEEVIDTNAVAVSKNNSAEAIEIDQGVTYLSQKDKSEREASIKDQYQSNHEEASKSNQDEDMDKGEEKVEPSIVEQNSKDRCEEASKTIQNENIDESERESEEEQEQSREVQQSEEEQEQSKEEQEQSEEEQQQSEEEPEQSEEEQEQSEEEREQSEEELEQNEEDREEIELDQEQNEELSIKEHESPNQSDGATKRTQDHDMIEKSDEQIDQENLDEDMEEMVWNDNDDEKASNTSEKDIDADGKQHNLSSQKNNNTRTNRSELKQVANKSINITNKIQKVSKVSVDKGELEEEDDVVEETPNNSTHDTTGRNRNREVSKVKSPEAVLQNMTNDNESFRPIGRSTTFRKSKSVYETMNMRHSLAPVQESTLGSEGSRNSSTEGSEWDSHRTTRKTIRQTLGKEYTTRKSLRALVMEQSAKRQTEIYNKTSKFDKTNNKTAPGDVNDRHTSKMNKTKNKTLIESGSNENASKLNKTQNKTITEDDKNDNASKLNKTKNKTVLEDINDQHIRFRRTSNRNFSSNQSPILKSPVHGISTSHVPDPLISEPQASYHKSQYDIKESEMSERNLTNPEDSVNIPIPENDSGPEISMNASYGEGMTASGHEVSKEISDEEILEKENTSPKPKRELSRRDTSMRSKPVYNSDQEVLDYEASEQVISGLEDHEKSEHDESVQDEKDSESENEEIEQSEQEVESEEENDSQQEIEPDSEHEETQEEIEEEESQEIEEQEQSRPEIESDQEESQEIEQEHESEQEQQSETSHDMSQESEQEDDHNMSNETDQDDDFISALNSEYKTPETRRDTRIVFDSNMMSVEEIDFEGVSRQSDNITGNESARRELSRASLQRASEPSVHDVSVGTKRSMLLMKMEEIAQQNMERRQKIRDNLQKILKPTRSCSVQDIGLQLPKYSIRRPQTEPKRPKVQRTKPTGVPVEALPKLFAEDLKYKPPKRFQPANAPWITKRLYKFLETKLEAKYDYRARVRAEELVQTIFSFSKLVRRREVAPSQAVDELKREMARLRIVNTHYEFYDFFHEFMPREIRVKVNPDVVNKIPMPRNGVFSEILQSRTVAE